MIISISKIYCLVTRGVSMSVSALAPRRMWQKPNKVTRIFGTHMFGPSPLFAG